MAHLAMAPQQLNNDCCRHAALHVAHHAACLWWQEGSSVLSLSSPNSASLDFFPGGAHATSSPFRLQLLHLAVLREGKHEAEAHHSWLEQGLHHGTSLDMPLPRALAAFSLPLNKEGMNASVFTGYLFFYLGNG